AARAVMAEAGGFKLAGRRLVHRDVLERYERLRVERPTPAVKLGRRRSTRDDREPEPLRSGFWQEWGRTRPEPRVAATRDRHARRRSRLLDCDGQLSRAGRNRR